MIKKVTYIIIVSLILTACGKVGPLVLPKEKIDKSIITYPCDTKCMEKFEAEKKRQKSVSLNLD